MRLILSNLQIKFHQLESNIPQDVINNPPPSLVIAYHCFAPSSVQILLWRVGYWGLGLGGVSPEHFSLGGYGGLPVFPHSWTLWVPMVQCDLMMIDGGHYNPAATDDLHNFAKSA